MTGRIEKKLIELNIDLPNPAAPVASYSPFILSNFLIFCERIEKSLGPKENSLSNVFLLRLKCFSIIHAP